MSQSPLEAAFCSMSPVTMVFGDGPIFIPPPAIPPPPPPPPPPRRPPRPPPHRAPPAGPHPPAPGPPPPPPLRWNPGGATGCQMKKTQKKGPPADGVLYSPG